MDEKEKECQRLFQKFKDKPVMQFIKQYLSLWESFENKESVDEIFTEAIMIDFNRIWEKILNQSPKNSQVKEECEREKETKEEIVNDIGLTEEELSVLFED